MVFMLSSGLRVAAEGSGFILAGLSGAGSSFNGWLQAIRQQRNKILFLLFSQANVF